MLTGDLYTLPALAALALAAAGILALLIRGIRDRWAAWGTRLRVRIGVVALSTLMLLLLAAAAANPRWIEVRPGQSLHLVLAVDVSNSVLRGPGGWDAVRAMVVERIEQTQAALENEAGPIKPVVTTSLVTFADGAEHQNTGNLEQLRQALLRLTPAFGGAESNLAAGLDRAREAVVATGGQGAVILVSDGHATTGDGQAAAQRLGVNGIPLYVWPVQGSGPATAIAASYVARMVDADTEIQARLMLANGDQPADNQVVVHVNPGVAEGQRLGAEENDTHTTPLGAQKRTSLRAPLRFTGAGMQLVELGLQTEMGEQERRRFYVQVKQPPKILAIGDARWAAALPQNVAQVTAILPAEFRGAADLAGVDAVVIGGTPATAFKAGDLDTLAEAVTQGGTGLFFVNGEHTGQPETTPTVLMSYDGTPLEPLLPVSTRPRPKLEDPPPLHIVMLIDTSGSMDGFFKLPKAKGIASHLIKEQMRPQDRLDLLIFTDTVEHLIVDSPMDPANKSAALAKVEGLAAGGGTRIGPALDAIANRDLGECGLIIITDLEFDVAKQRPECKSTIFAVGANAGYGSPLEAFAEPFYVGPDFSPANIKLSIYNPEPRDNYFEPGQYQALSAERQGSVASRLPVPELPLWGNAISYLVEDAELVAVRPRLTDPVLAYKRSGSGYVGALTTGFPATWLDAEEGRQAVSAWVQRVLPFVAQNRYVITLEDTGNRLRLRVELTGEGGPLPQVDRISVAAELAGGLIVDADMQADPEAAGTFVGQLALPAQAGGIGLLVIEEQGPEALPRPQRLPFVIPPPTAAGDGLAQEDYSFGTALKGLEQMAAATQGAVLADEPLPIMIQPQGGERAIPLWPGLLVASLVCLVAAVALPRWLP